MNSAMKSVRIARKIDRPNTREFIDKLFENFMEMHGDRLFADDGSIVGGIASFEGIPVTVIEYRKVILLMKMLSVILEVLIPRDTEKHLDL